MSFDEDGGFDPEGGGDYWPINDECDGWLRAFQRELEGHRWRVAADSLCQLHPLMEDDPEEFLPYDWTDQICDTIRGVPGAAKALRRYYRRDIQRHDAGVVDTICVHREYAVQILKMLGGC